MSVRVMTWVWDHSQSKKTDRLVLLAIADCASDDGRNAYPSMAELVRKTGLSERGVQTSITRLVASKELRVYRNAGPGGCNRYRVIMTPAESAPPARHAPPQNLHPPAESAPAESAPPRTPCATPPQELRGTPARRAPGTVLEPSVEPSVVQNLSAPQSARDPRGTRLPENFAPDDAMKAWFAEHCQGVNGREEHAKFVDYWRGAPGAKGRKTDWPATWRNWMRKAAEDTAKRRPATGANRHIDRRPDQNPFRTGEAKAIYSSQPTGSTR